MKSLKTIRVLVVEDNPVTLEALSAYLVGQGHEMTTAGNGLGAFVAVQAFSPDVVVTDHVMPALDGLGLLRHLRTDPATARLPVIIITALADGPELDKLCEELTTLQPARLLRKPFDPPSLLELIRSMPRMPGSGDSRVDVQIPEVLHGPVSDR